MAWTTGANNEETTGLMKDATSDYGVSDVHGFAEEQQFHRRGSFSRRLIVFHIVLLALYTTLFWSFSLGFWQGKSRSEGSLVYCELLQSVSFRGLN